MSRREDGGKGRPCKVCFEGWSERQGDAVHVEVGADVAGDVVIGLWLGDHKGARSQTMRPPRPKAEGSALMSRLRSLCRTCLG